MSTTTPLPFAELPEIASREQARSISKARHERLYTYDIDSLIPRKDFNGRKRRADMTDQQWEIHLHIPALADGIYWNNGPADPIEGDVVRAGDEIKFVITEGHRREMAIRYLLREGKTTYPNGQEIRKVDVLINPKGMTELDRIKKQWTSQNKMKLMPMELAAQWQMIKDAYNMSNLDIAKMYTGDISISRQTVDNMLSLHAHLSEQEKELVDSGVLKITAALDQVRAKRKVEREEVAVKEPKSKKKSAVPPEEEEKEDNEMESAATVNEDVPTSEKDEYIGRRVQDHNEKRGWTGKITKKMPPENAEDPLYEIHWDNANKDVSMVPLSNIVFATTTVDNSSAISQEEKARTTDGNFKETRSKDDRKDALSSKLDEPQQEWETRIYRSISNTDKIEVISNKLPKELVQYSNDINQTMGWIRKDLQEALSLIRDLLKERR